MNSSVNNLSLKGEIHIIPVRHYPMPEKLPKNTVRVERRADGDYAYLKTGERVRIDDGSI